MNRRLSALLLSLRSRGILFDFDSGVISGCEKAKYSEFGLRRFGMLSHSSAGATGRRKCPLIGASVASESYLYGRRDVGGGDSATPVDKSCWR